MGVGSVPQEPIRTEGASDEFQRSEHRRIVATRGVDRRRLTTRERATARMARARWAEDLVAKHYRSDGYEIIARNWFCREGELDIVAVSPIGEVKTIVVIEVRARRTTYFGSPFESITMAKQNKLRRATTQFLASQPRTYGTVRFDVVSVLGARVEIVRDAF